MGKESKYYKTEINIANSYILVMQTGSIKSKQTINGFIESNRCLFAESPITIEKRWLCGVG